MRCKPSVEQIDRRDAGVRTGATDDKPLPRADRLWRRPCGSRPWQPNMRRGNLFRSMAATAGKAPHERPGPARGRLFAIHRASVGDLADCIRNAARSWKPHLPVRARRSDPIGEHPTGPCSGRGGHGFSTRYLPAAARGCARLHRPDASRIHGASGCVHRRLSYGARTNAPRDLALPGRRSDRRLRYDSSSIFEFLIPAFR